MEIASAIPASNDETIETKNSSDPELTIVIVLLLCFINPSNGYIIEFNCLSTRSYALTNNYLLGELNLVLFHVMWIILHDSRRLLLDVDIRNDNLNKMINHMTLPSKHETLNQCWVNVGPAS